MGTSSGRSWPSGINKGHIHQRLDLDGRAFMYNGGEPSLDSSWAEIDLSIEPDIFQKIDEKGQANGYASLDAEGKIPSLQLNISSTSFSLGEWDSSKSENVVYQAETDLYVVAYAGQLTTITLLTDSSNPPTTVRSRANGPSDAFVNVSCVVKSGDYWKVERIGSTSATINIISMS